VNILFDLDGTLLDPREGIVRSIQHALARMEEPVLEEQALLRFIGPPLRQSFMDLLKTDNEELVELAITYYRERFSATGLYENAVYDQVEELLDQLSIEGHDLYIATSKPAFYAEKIVCHFGLRSAFRNVYGSEMDGRLSDKQDLIGHLMLNENISASDAVMIGDREYDIRGAAGNDMMAIGALWGYGGRRELEEAGATHLCETPLEVLELIP
jgi:phosphoglycolate phosphatase